MTKEGEEEKRKREAAVIRKDLIMKVLLGEKYLTVPLKPHYLVEVPYEPFRKQIIQEMQSHEWICLVDEKTAKQQGANYGTELRSKLLEIPADLVDKKLV